jgi:hypothetical protein
VVDQQHVKCGIVLTQLSQETQDDTDADEPPFIANNEIVLNMEPISGSVGVGDVVADAEFISDVDHSPIATYFALDIDLLSIEPEFMPEYEVAFGDERVEDSTDDQPVFQLSNKDKAMLQRALAEHAPEMPDYWDLSQAHRVVVDGLWFNDNVFLINHDNVIIQKGIIFKTMETMKIWLVEYTVFHHCPYMVKHLDENKRYVVTCHRGFFSNLIDYHLHKCLVNER